MTNCNLSFAELLPKTVQLSDHNVTMELPIVQHMSKFQRAAKLVTGRNAYVINRGQLESMADGSSL